MSEPYIPNHEHEFPDGTKALQAAALGLGLFEREVILPHLIRRESFDNYKGMIDDKVNVRVEGILPWHTYAWRNDRSEDIVFDVYKETSFSLGFNIGNIYSAVRMTDEQFEMDVEKQWGPLLNPQTKAVARGVSQGIVDAFGQTTYEATIGAPEDKLRAALIEARRVLNLLHAPDTNRTLLVGSDFEAALLNDDKLTLANAVGDANADSALRNATLGKLFGFNIVATTEIAPDEALAFTDSAWMFVTAAPYVPQSVPTGATASADGYAMRWIRQYDLRKMMDVSLVNTWAGVAPIRDKVIQLKGADPSNPTERVVSENDYNLRSIKLKLNGTSVYSTDADLVAATGLALPKTGALAAPLG